MTVTSTVHALAYRLILASPEQVADLTTILERGAGLLPLPDGESRDWPPGLVPERRPIWLNLADAIYLDRVRSHTVDEAEAWRLIRAGASIVRLSRLSGEKWASAIRWDSVLATLVIEQEWPIIADTARELRAQEDSI